MVSFNMDKLAYHYNKKKLKGSQEGMYLYYYPCKHEEQANAHIGHKGYIVIEVTEQQWEALFEMDRFEYNNFHKYVRHTNRLKDIDEDALKPQEQERLLDHKNDFDRVITASDNKLFTDKLTENEQKILELADKGLTQSAIAEKLGFAQSYVSVTLKQAKAKISAMKSKTETADERANRYWEMFIEKGEMPGHVDVLYFYILHCFTTEDTIYFLEWFYSFGELMRYIMRYNFETDEDKQQKTIADFFANATDEEKDRFSMYEKMIYPVQYVYICLYKETLRRKKDRLKHKDFYSMVNGVYIVLLKIAKRLGTTPEEFLQERFVPFFVEFRDRRVRTFYKYYTGKDLPE